MEFIGARVPYYSRRRHHTRSRRGSTSAIALLGATSFGTARRGRLQHLIERSDCQEALLDVCIRCERPSAASPGDGSVLLGARQRPLSLVQAVVACHRQPAAPHPTATRGAVLTGGSIKVVVEP